MTVTAQEIRTSTLAQQDSVIAAVAPKLEEQLFESCLTRTCGRSFKAWVPSKAVVADQTELVTEGVINRLVGLCRASGWQAEFDSSRGDLHYLKFIVPPRQVVNIAAARGGASAVVPSVVDLMSRVLEYQDKIIAVLEPGLKEQLQESCSSMSPGRSFRVWLPQRVGVEGSTEFLSEGVRDRLLDVYRRNHWQIEYAGGEGNLCYFRFIVPRSG